MKLDFKIIDILTFISRCPRQRAGFRHRSTNEKPHDWRIFDGVIGLWREKRKSRAVH